MVSNVFICNESPVVNLVCRKEVKELGGDPPNRPVILKYHAVLGTF